VFFSAVQILKCTKFDSDARFYIKIPALYVYTQNTHTHTIKLIKVIFYHTLDRIHLDKPHLSLEMEFLFDLPILDGGK